MGNTTAEVRTCNTKEPTKYIDIDLLVDTGSTYTWVRASELKELGVEPMSRVRFRTIEDRVTERDIDEAIIESISESHDNVVFAQEGDAEVLGGILTRGS